MASNMELLLEFQGLQETRAQTYAAFQEEFKKFLEEKDQTKWEAVCAKTGPVFQNINVNVRKCESALKQADKPDLAALLDRIQLAEKDKFTWTLEWYGLQSKYIVLLEDEHNAEFLEKSRDYRRRLHTVVSTINEILEDIRYIVDDLQQQQQQQQQQQEKQ